MTRLEDMLAAVFHRLAQNPVTASAFLFGTACLFLLPGVISLPPVDRTEVVFAQVARQMREAWDFSFAAYQDKVMFDRPFGTLWIQVLFSAALSEPNEIWGYRAASVTFIVIACVLCYLLARGVYGNLASLLGALWLAGIPLIAMQAHLSISKPLMLPFVVIAQLSLAQIYCRQTESGAGKSIWAFWIAQAIAVPVGGMSVAAVSAATVLGLSFLDRDVHLLRRIMLHPAVLVWLGVTGVWGALLWQYVSQHLPQQVDLWTFILEVAEPQKMHIAKLPGAFFVVLIAGALPVLLVAFRATEVALDWRTHAPVRFLLAWIFPYLVLMELLSGLPPTYMVQAVIPAVTLLAGVALSGASASQPGRWPMTESRWLSFWLVIIATQPLSLAAFAWFTGVVPSALATVTVVASTIAFAFAIYALKIFRPYTFITFACVSGVLFFVFFFRLLIPPYKETWPSWQMQQLTQRAAPCAGGQPTTVFGYFEPSVVFLLGTKTILTSSAREAADASKSGLVVVNKTSGDAFENAVDTAEANPDLLACANGFNYARAKKVSFRLYGPSGSTERQDCVVAPEYRCSP